MNKGRLSYSNCSFETGGNQLLRNFPAKLLLPLYCSVLQLPGECSRGVMDIVDNWPTETQREGMCKRVWLYCVPHITIATRGCGFTVYHITIATRGCGFTVYHISP